MIFQHCCIWKDRELSTMDMERIWGVFFPYGQKTAMGRFALILVCTVVLWLSGGLAVTFTEARPAPGGQTSVALAKSVVKYQSSPIIVPTATPSPTPTATPVPTATPSPTPTATPVPTATPTSAPAPTVVPTTSFPTNPGSAQGRIFYHGNQTLPEIALTFDDGPNPPYTSQILAILRRYSIKATFFDVGHLVQAYPALVKEEVAEGNVVGNHTWAHPYLPALSGPSIAWQLTTTSDAIQQVTGIRPTYFRPPYGAFNASILAYANQLGLSTFIWNVDPRDWSRPGTNAIVARVRAQTGNGSIILMHDGGGDRSQTVAALPTIIEWYQQHGFRFVTLQQLVADLHSGSVMSAQEYTSSYVVSSPASMPVWRRRDQNVS